MEPSNNERLSDFRLGAVRFVSMVDPNSVIGGEWRELYSDTEQVGELSLQGYPAAEVYRGLNPHIESPAMYDYVDIGEGSFSVSYTHLTLPTICSV